MKKNETENEEALLKAFKELCTPDVPDDVIEAAILGSESHWSRSILEKVKDFLENRPYLVEKINQRLSKTV